MKRLVLIDSYAIIHRAWHALPPLTGPQGQPVNAVYGFASILLKMLKELKPDYVVAAFDHPGPTFRHLAFERYKAERQKAPDALYQQIPLVRELLDAFGIPVIEKQGYEADDIIGTIVREVRSKHHDTEIVIVTGDLDTLQLVDRSTRVFTMKKGITDTVLYDEAAVRERYGLSPRQLIDFKGLRGDPSDNIPGVKGVGEKTAAELLQAHGSVEEVYRALKKGKLDAKPGIVAALQQHEADALFSKTLGTIDRNVPIKFALAPARLRKSAVKENVTAVLQKFGFESLVRRLGGGGGVAPKQEETVPVRTPRAVRPIRVESFADIHERGGAAVLSDSTRAVLLVAVQGGQAYELPETALRDPAAPPWFRSHRPLSVFDWKSVLRAGFSGESDGIRDLKIMWWLLEPERRTYEPTTLVEKHIPGALPLSPAETVAFLMRVAPLVEERLRAEDMGMVYDDLEAPLIPILHVMEQNGIGVDVKPLHRLGKQLGRDIAKLERGIYGECGGAFNIDSPRQLADVLFGRLKLEAKGIRRTEKSGTLSTRESELVKLENLHPVVSKILRYRELAKLKSTYVDALPRIVGRDGRIHTTWNQTGTATGRLSSSDPNLQNIPIRSPLGREIRNAFVAERGCALVAFDYSQLELRIAADLAGDEKMSAAFARGEDIHRMTASEVNNIPLEQVTAELRARAKTLNFGVLYGMGARAFAETAGVSREEAQFFIEEYFRDFQGIRRFIEETKEFARSHGYTKTAFGRKRFFPDFGASNFRLQREAERMAVNHPIQGTEADIMKKAMVEVDAAVRQSRRGDRVRLLLQIHDELIFEVRTALVREVATEIRAIMEGVWKGNVSMKVEVKQGKNWGALE